MILTIEKVLELKILLDEKYNVKLHFHDACGAQYFSFDSPINDDVIFFITKYFSEYKHKPRFTEKRDSFKLNNIT